MSHVQVTAIIEREGDCYGALCRSSTLRVRERQSRTRGRTCRRQLNCSWKRLTRAKSNAAGIPKSSLRASR